MRASPGVPSGHHGRSCTPDVQGYPAAQADTHMNLPRHHSHRGGQGFNPLSSTQNCRSEAHSGLWMRHSKIICHSVVTRIRRRRATLPGPGQSLRPTPVMSVVTRYEATGLLATDCRSRALGASRVLLQPAVVTASGRRIRNAKAFCMLVRPCCTVDVRSQHRGHLADGDLQVSHAAPGRQLASSQVDRLHHPE